MSLWTCIARCSTCDKELNRAEHVPENKKSQVSLTAPVMAVCDIKEHNTFSDLNLRVKLEWVEENSVRG
jgi:hypothetical protein